MIYQTIDNASQLRDAFHKAGRYEQFSYQAYEYIFEYLEDYGSDIELDVVAICCEFTEEHFEGIANDNINNCDEMDEDEQLETVEEYLNDNTSIIGKLDNGNFIYISF